MSVPPAIPLSLPIPNPNLKTLLDAMQNNTLANLNCHAIGTVQSFQQGVVDGAPNGLYTCKVTINYSRTYFNIQPDGTYIPQQKSYPTLIDCPTVILGGGNTFLSFPIKAGDQCLVLFNDRDLNNWFAGARSGPVATARLHSIADGIALVGFAPVASYDASHALLSNGNAQVGVPADLTGTKVRIANQTATLYNLLSNLITAIEGIKVSPGTFVAGSTPVTGISGSVADTAALEAAKAALAQLLE